MHSVCFRCHDKCIIDVEVAEGKVVKVKGAACVKGTTIPDVMYQPDRLMYPLKRVGERGEGKWERISWDEATTTIATRLNELKAKYGPENLYLAGGSRQKHIGNEAIETGAALFPAPNRQCGRQECGTTRRRASLAIVGEDLIQRVRTELEYTNCIMVWGANLSVTAPPINKRLNKAVRRGAKLIVVDPRPTDLAKKADIWLQIRPGTDAALALAMIHTIIDEELYDKEFVEKWCVGFDELKEQVKQCSPEWAAEVTWIPKENIVKAARLYATTKPASFMSWLGTEQSPLSFNRARGLIILVALTGNIDVRGGNLLTDRFWIDKDTLVKTGTAPKSFHPKIDPKIDKKRFGADRYPLLMGRCDIYEVRRGMFDGRIRSLWCIAHNILVAEADTRQVLDAMKNKLEFIVVSDFFMTPTAEFADIVLPAAFYQEIDTLSSAGQYPLNYITASPKVVEPPGECRDDVEVVLEVARKMGADVPWNSHKEMLNWAIKDVGLTFDDIYNKPGHKIEFPRAYKKYEKSTPAFYTSSGKVELCFTEDRAKQLRVNRLLVHQELPESPVSTPDLFKEFPFIYTHRRLINFMHTEGRQVKRQRKLSPDPYLEIAPETASKFGLSEGDWVHLETTKSAREKWPPLRYRAKIVPKMLPCLVAGSHGWWFPEKPGPEHGCFESNINAALSAGPPYDPVSGVSFMRGILCRIEKAA